MVSAAPLMCVQPIACTKKIRIKFGSSSICACHVAPCHCYTLFITVELPFEVMMRREQNSTCCLCDGREHCSLQVSACMSEHSTQLQMNLLVETAVTAFVNHGRLADLARLIT